MAQGRARRIGKSVVICKTLGTLLSLDLGCITLPHFIQNQRSQFTHHEKMNVRADELTHAITLSMPMYASFRRPVTGETTLWYQPTEYKNVGRGAMYEVTDNAYKHITLTAQRRASTRRQLLKDGEMLATHVRMSTGRTRSDVMPSRVTKLIH